MHSERWQTCTDIFTLAVEQSPNERAAILERSCDGDEALRRKVELLLKYHDTSGDFIETPAFAVAPELLVADPEALIGQHLGCYRVDALLGAGGMGVVYLASDERLGRKVALKLLPPSMVPNEAELQRLKREARTASALNHPNIVTIHEIGQVESTHYVATEFIEGTTLRELMIKASIPPNEALDIAIQVASALSVAHRAGIVHRDIKPENIMLRPDGYVKVLDFGIAKVAQQAATGAKTSTAMHLRTQEGMILGTARYMSPEQAKGQAVDARSDLWSLGVVLYEMLAGRAPFEGETPTDVIAAILLSEPRPLEPRVPIVPPALQKVVDRCLQKSPANRYPTAEEMLSDLRAIKQNAARAAGADTVRGYNSRQRAARWIGAAALAAVFVVAALFYAWREGHPPPPHMPDRIAKGIAVLPFENLSPDNADAFFADGIQDDILTSVGRIKDLKVIARSSMEDYRDARARGKVREIGDALGVSHVLQGSVRRGGDRVVVNVALIDTRAAHQVWSERYERTLTDALSLQRELAVEIARELHATLTPGEEAAVVAGRPTENADAYLLYLRGRGAEIANDAMDQVEPAIELYQKAVDLDPAFALARARLSLCASRMVDREEPGEWKAKARTEAEEALRLQPQLGEARLALTHCFLWGDHDYERALAELARAAELLPNSAEVPLTAAYIYKRQNRYRERVAALRRAEVLDPRNIRVLGLLTSTLRWLREWPQAMATGDRLTAVAPQAFVCYTQWRRAHDEFRLTGDIDVLKRTIAQAADVHPPVSGDWLNMSRYELAVLERDYTAAGRFLAAVPSEAFTTGRTSVGAHPKSFYEALLAVASNSDAPGTQQALETVRTELEKRVGAVGMDQPETDLPVILAFLGRKEDAIGLAKLALERQPPGTVEQNEAYAALAMVYAHTGEPDKAVQLIEHLLTVPVELQRGAVYNITLVDLKWRWEWDPLRSHPRFQKLLAGPEPKTRY